MPRTWGLALSLALHAALGGSVGLAWHSVPAPRPPQRLMVELLGVVSKRQAEEARAGEPAAPAPKAATPPPPRRAEPPKAAPRADAASPAKLPDTTLRDEAPAAAPTPAAEAPKAASAVAAAAAATAMGAAPEPQVRQTLAHADLDLDAQRRYLAALTKAIKARLTYPPDAGGVTGTPVVGFRLGADGRIEPGTLAIRRSSGWGVLDAQALRAVRLAAPFEPPPQAMDIALEMPFTRDQ